MFLDEIGELPLSMQPKLLRALERREVRPIGSSKSHAIDVRVVAATHRDLARETNTGQFREDLYFRLAVVRARLPALRERRSDIPDLVRLFVQNLDASRLGEVDAIVGTLERRAFVGNVRELRNAVEERLILTRPEEWLTTGDGEPSPTHSPTDRGELPAAVYAMSYKEASELSALDFQKKYVTRLLERTDGNVSEAARQAGMSRRYLQTIIARLGLGQ